MDTFLLILILAGCLGGGFLLWTYTKSGKKWLKDL